MGCRLVPVRHLLDNDDAPWLGIPCRGLGSGLGAGVSYHAKRLDQAGNAAWSNAPSQVSSSRRDQLQPPDGCPTDEGPTSNPDRRTGPMTEDLNTPPVRPALPAESNLKSASAAFPRGQPEESESIPKVRPGQQGPCPQDFYGGKPRKSQTTRLLSAVPQAARIAPAGVIAEIGESS